MTRAQLVWHRDCFLRARELQQEHSDLWLHPCVAPFLPPPRHWLLAGRGCEECSMLQWLWGQIEAVSPKPSENCSPAGYKHAKCMFSDVPGFGVELVKGTLLPLGGRGQLVCRETPCTQETSRGQGYYGLTCVANGSVKKSPFAVTHTLKNHWRGRACGWSSTFFVVQVGVFSHVTHLWHQLHCWMPHGQLGGQSLPLPPPSLLAQGNGWLYGGWQMLWWKGMLRVQC